MEAIAAAFVLAACGEISDVDSQDTLDPQAVATVIAYPTTTDASGNVSVTVRSMAEVLLSGKDSVGGDKPILRYEWNVVGQPGSCVAAYPETCVQVTKRTNSTWSFTAPQVADPTDLQFQLSVEDSDGKASQARVDVSVIPALDANMTLYDELTSRSTLKERSFAVVVYPAAAISAGTADVPFELQVRKKIVYRRRADPPAPAPKTGSVDLGVIETVQGQLIGAIGNPGADPGAPESPRFVFDIPLLNADDVNRDIQLSGSNSAQQDDLLDAVDIDDADVQLEVSVRPTGSALGVGLAILRTGGFLERFDGNGQPYQAGILTSAAGAPLVAENDGTLAAATVSVTAEELRVAQDAIESRQIALSYYDAIDPNHTRTTLTDWLAVNCFDETATDYGTSGADGARAIYYNNYDLGFGRDMYMRTTPCGPGFGILPAEFIDGDIASVVFNYPTLESAIKKTSPIIAVAMEYRSLDPVYNCEAGNGCVRTATFYVYAPDDKSGEWRRVTSANFDGRGEKTVPAVCVSCHRRGPSIEELDEFGNFKFNHDGGAFMPFDLKSLRFADTDPSFSQQPEDAGLKDDFSMASQEDALRKLNDATLLALVDIPFFDQNGLPMPDPFDWDFSAIRELVNGWYETGSYNADYVPPGWRDGAIVNTLYDFDGDGVFQDTYTNPAGTESFYLDVVAQNCRACHIQDGDFRTYADFIRYEVEARGTDVPRAEYVASGSVFLKGAMPSARLTADRFWVEPVAGSTAAELLRTNLSNALDRSILATPTQPVDISNQLPGVPSVDGNELNRIEWDEIEFRIRNTTANGFLDERFANSTRTMELTPNIVWTASPGWLRPDAAIAYFADVVQWDVCYTATAADTCAQSSVVVVGSDSRLAAFNASQAGVYWVTLTATDKFGRTTTTNARVDVSP